MAELIRNHDWRDGLGPMAHWPPSLRSALSICLNSRFPTAIYWGQDLRLLYNDSWAPIPAERHPWALGRAAKEVWSDIWEVVGPQFEHVFRTGEGYSAFDQMLPMVRDGVRCETYWNYSFSVIRDENGTIVGIFNQGNETTAAVLARRKAQAEIDRLGRMFAEAPGAMAILSGPSHQFEIVNPAYEALVGRRNLIGRTVAEALPEIVAQGFVEILDAVYTSGDTHSGRAVPVGLERSEGRIEQRVVDFVFQPLTNSDGARRGIFIQATDITDASRAESALRDSEEFNRSLVESSEDCLAVIELDHRIGYINSNGLRLLGIDGSDTLAGTPWPALWPDESQGDVQSALADAADGRAARFSARGATVAGSARWWDVIVTPVLGQDGRPVRLLSISRDVTEQRNADEARHLLLRELNHRIKNLFAVTSGMVSLTARAAPTVAAMAKALQGRLLALAKAHELVQSAFLDDQRNPEAAPLKSLIEELLRPHCDTTMRKLDLSGPHILVGPTASTSLALIFHELATNAAKYGAFRDADGRVAVEWKRVGDRMELTWRETLASGTIEAPQSEGFGSRLARSSATNQLGGSIDFDWQADGLRILLTAALDRLAQ